MKDLINNSLHRFNFEKYILQTQKIKLNKKETLNPKIRWQAEMKQLNCNNKLVNSTKDKYKAAKKFFQ